LKVAAGARDWLASGPESGYPYFLGEQTMIHLPEIIRQLTGNAAAIRALVQNLSEEQMQWKPDAATWSMQEVMEHVYNEERVDFRQHLREMFSVPPLPWGGLQEGWIRVESMRQALDAFLIEREASIAWLESLESPDWDISIKAEFGPEAEEYVFKAGDLLVSWVAHDHLHLRQMNELMYAWNEDQAAPYSLQCAGGW
jgi:hypothetical protein